MAKFNSPTTIKTNNKSGHVAYSMADKSKLVTQVLTSFFNESKFYGDNSNDMKQTIQKAIAQDPGFVANLAVFARREFNMRSVSHVLAAFLAHEENGKKFARDVIDAVALRGDDVTETMAFYLSEFGKPIPNSLKKGINDALSRFDEYTLAKYKGSGKAVKMRDLLCLCRPKPKDKEQEALWKRCLEDKLEIPETWETQLSANGNKREVWEKLIKDNKLNYMAALRNLRNLVEANPYNLDKVLQKLSDPEAVKRSKQLPFRYLSAYKSLPNASSKVLDALEDAVDASIANLPKIPGKTVIAIDVSGSMNSRVSAKSEVKCAEIALLLGMIANRLCEDALVYAFDTKLYQFDISHRTGILYAAVHQRVSGGGTNMSLPFEKIIKDRIICDRMIILSDNECNSGITWFNHRTVQSLADEYRQKTGMDIWVHAIDLQGYGTQQFFGGKTNIIGGWSEKVFEFIKLAEDGEGNLEKTIASYRW